MLPPERLAEGEAARGNLLDHATNTPRCPIRWIRAGNAAEFLQGEPAADGTWRFAIGRERHGAFGGAFGGLLAACTVVVARSAAPGRRPLSLDARFLRGLTAGDALLRPTLVHTGRSLTCVSLDVLDDSSRLATRATVYLVEPGALREVDHAGEGGTAPESVPWSEGTPWRNPPGMDVPIVSTFAPRAVGRAAQGIGTALRVPWDDPGASAEAACLVADICVGPPVAGAFPGTPTPAPNPDLSLRFTGEEPTEEVVGWGLLKSITAGVATVGIEVRCGEALLALGVSCSLLLSRSSRRRDVAAASLPAGSPRALPAASPSTRGRVLMPNTRAALRARILARVSSHTCPIWCSIAAAECGHEPSWCG